MHFNFWAYLISEKEIPSDLLMVEIFSIYTAHTEVRSFLLHAKKERKFGNVLRNKIASKSTFALIGENLGTGYI